MLTVIDINGVLGDVVKTKKKISSKPDVILPSGQYFYISPYASKIIKDSLLCGKIIIWTSRKRKNAEPIIEFLKIRVGLPANTVMLTGEDCLFCINYKPVKDVCVLRSKFPEFKLEKIVFIDDNPTCVILDNNSNIKPHSETSIST
jgi:hypothetical protein